MIEVPFKFSLEAPVSFPTGRGGRLELSGYSLLGFYSLELTKDPGDEQDVITSFFRIGDLEGRVWKATSRCTTAKLLPLLYSFGRITKEKSLKEESVGFETLISGARLYDDSREVVTFYLESGNMNVYLKHFGCQFTLSVDKSNSTELILSTEACVRAESRRELVDLSLTTILNPSDMIFTNTATLYSGLSAAGSPLQYWFDSPIPLPIIFDLEEGTLEVQDGVSYDA